MRLILLTALALFVCLSASVEAQVPTAPLLRIAWDIAAPDPTDAAGSLAAVRLYTVKRYVDTATIGIPLIGVTCAAGTPPAAITCSVALPALPLGPHKIQLTATGSDGVESAKSTPPFPLTISVSAGVPSNTRLTPLTP